MITKGDDGEDCYQILTKFYKMIVHNEIKWQMLDGSWSEIKIEIALIKELLRIWIMHMLPLIFDRILCL